MKLVPHDWVMAEPQNDSASKILESTKEKWETNINACITIYSLINGNDDVIYGPVNGVFYRFPFYEWPDMDIRWPE